MTQQQQQTQSVTALSPAELELIESALSATRAGGPERAALDPTTGAVSGVRPVEDGAADFASVSAIARHGASA